MSKNVESGAIREIPVYKILPSPNQPRRHYFDDEKIKELADSIRREGLIQLIAVRPLEDNNYELIAGERRWRAHQSLGLKTIPATIKHVNAEDAAIMTLIENLQREDLTLIEEASSLDVWLQKHNGDYQVLAKNIGKSFVYIRERPRDAVKTAERDSKDDHRLYPKGCGNCGNFSIGRRRWISCHCWCLHNGIIQSRSGDFKNRSPLFFFSFVLS